MFYKSLFSPLFIGFFTILPLTSCMNIYDPVDSPSGDAQILSAARAQFDKGNLTEARDLYLKLGTSDSALAELAFLDLNEAGVSMTTLTIALQVTGSEGVGSILTKIAEGIQKNTSTSVTTKRTSLQNSYARVASIQNQKVRGFVRFLVGLSIAAEVLSENTFAADGVISKSDIVTSTTTCTTSNLSGCAVDTNCGLRSGSGIAIGTSTQSVKFQSTTDTSITISSPTYLLMTDALLGATKGLTELAITSGDAYTLTSELSTYIDAMVLAPNAATTQCFLSALINRVGVGQ